MNNYAYFCLRQGRKGADIKAMLSQKQNLEK